MNEQHFDALPPVNANVPSSEQANRPSTEQPAQSPEAAPAAHGEQPGSGFVNPAAAAVPPAGGTPLTGSNSSDDIVSQQMAAPTPAIAEDVDLIEKEWVLKAKQIVEKTKHDPYLQNEEMTKIKADYLKKRYNRDIKAPKA